MKAKKPKAAKVPVRYSQALADRICTRLADGESLNSICQGPNMPSERAVRFWALDDHDGFAPKYARARQVGYERLAEDILTISDEQDIEMVGVGENTRLDLSATAVARNRLRVDTRKWLLSKVLPKVYGDKQTLEHTGTLNVAEVLSAARKRSGKPV